MKLNCLKNIEGKEILKLSALVEYQQGQIVSRTLAQNSAVSLTLFAFDAGEEISSHESGGDAMVTILEGEGHITVDGQAFDLTEGESIVMPAGLPHAVEAKKPFKMQLTVIFPTVRL